MRVTCAWENNGHIPKEDKPFTFLHTIGENEEGEPICKWNRTQDCIGDTIAGYGTICKLNASVRVEIRKCNCPLGK